MPDEKKIGLRFSESMSGYLAEGEGDFAAGERKGKETGQTVSFKVAVSIDDIEDFCKFSGRRARLDGSISGAQLGRDLPICDGTFGLFIPDIKSGERQMTYSFKFTAQDGRNYSLLGYKIIRHDKHKLDMAGDLTSLFTQIHKGDSAGAPLFGSGILRFSLPSLPAMLASFAVSGTSSPVARWKAVAQFFAFCYGEVRDTYLAGYGPFYYTEYENLVLTGKLDGQGREHTFFFFSGVHDKDFPWGDGESFWDVALMLQKDDGAWARYALTDRRIENLELNVQGGLYRYEGPLYEILEGNQISWSELNRASRPARLKPIHARIELRLDREECEPVNVPFSLIPKSPALLPAGLLETLRERLPGFESLGWQMIPHKIHILEGSITLQDGDSRGVFRLPPEAVLGEAERATMVNIRRPKLYYQYTCSLCPESENIHVRVRSDAFRANRKDVVADKIEEALGKVIRHTAALDLEIDADGWKIIPVEGAGASQKGDQTLLEINNDHFPTAVFQRRIISVQDPRGRTVLGLQEEMDPFNLGCIESNRGVKAAAIKDRDKYKALDRVLEETGFFQILEAARERSGKSREGFSIIVKPNFMFMYSVKDRSTFTDPELIEHLMNRLHERGYGNLACAEARSTYGMYFTHREVKTVARYIGLSGRNYRVIDLSENLEPHSFPGKLGPHFVNREWKEADFRIAFAKNKTHSYARYTLTLKVIYGALPLENKFLEYHHRRDIYTTTIEFLKAFPVHFALIDAFVSADGPFGIFADQEPNHTETIIGSEDPIAADWIGAAKMGLDPLVSDYMKYAVETFGKPQIQFTGDRSIYPGWVNVTDVLPFALFETLDPHYYFGNIFYSVFAYMDDFFRYKDPSLAKRFARLLAGPVKSLVFQKVRKGEFDEETNKSLFKMFTGN